MPKIQDLSALKTAVRKSMAKEDYEQVFDLLDDVLIEDSPLKSDLLAQQAKLNRTRRNRERGTLNGQDAETAYTQVLYAVETIIKEIESDAVRADAFPLQWSAPEAASPASDTVSALEREGLEKQAELLQRKLNSLKQAQITAYDAAQKFALEEQIRELEETLVGIRGKLG
jgi:hypothetical protein